MKIVFTTSNKIGSKLIQWILDEPVSHVAVIFPSQNKVFQSTLAGVHSLELSEFLENHEIVYEINVEVQDEKLLYDSLIEKYEGHKYDVSAFIYFGYRAFLRKYFKIPFPKHNIFNNKHEEICVEIGADALNMKNVDASMITPYGLYLILKEKYG